MTDAAVTKPRTLLLLLLLPCSLLESAVGCDSIPA